VRGVILLLPEQGVVRGLVLDAAAGLPVDGALVSIRSGMDRIRPDPLGIALDVRTGADGRFELGGLEAGRYTLTAQKECFAPGSSITYLFSTRSSPSFAALGL